MGKGPRSWEAQDNTITILYIHNLCNFDEHESLQLHGQLHALAQDCHGDFPPLGLTKVLLSCTRRTCATSCGSTQFPCFYHTELAPTTYVELTFPRAHSPAHQLLCRSSLTTMAVVYESRDITCTRVRADSSSAFDPCVTECEAFKIPLSFLVMFATAPQVPPECRVEATKS